jgi:hypothetical protein
MKNVFEFVSGKQLFDQRDVHDRAFDKFHAVGNVIAKTAAQIVQANDLMALLQQMPANVRADETRRAGDQNL